MHESLAEIRWKGHEKFIQKGVRFQPKYAEMLTRVANERKISQRELLEECLRQCLGEPEEKTE